MYEEKYPVTKLANAKYAAAAGSIPSSPVGKDAGTGLRMGRRRSRTLPTPRTVGAPDRDIAATSAAHHSRGTDNDCRGPIPSHLLDGPKEGSYFPTGDYCSLSKDEVSGRHRQAGELRSPVPQPGSPRTPIRKGRARVQPGRNPLLFERQLVEEFRSPNGWPDSNHKRRASSFLSPKSIQEDEPEKKRVRDKRFESETVIGKRQPTEPYDPTAFVRSGNVEMQPVMLKHIVDIVSSSNGTNMANASGKNNRLAENVEDHVKILHRSMGPMKKRRLGGLAQLKLQRELKKERPDEYSSKPSDMVETASRTGDEE
ncbi:hypothetical protein LZ30DRAFT_321284 [Colletotrichum cereale]|nr:hypothetical protein LZ30DRAFT_321284 [Colletotrichum cereale]